MSPENLLHEAGIWRANDWQVTEQKAISTGFKALDQALTGGGLPQGALTEILTERDGSSSLQLVVPALAQLSRDDRWIAFVAPPHIPYAPALAQYGIDLSRVLLVHPDKDDTLWATEQALRAGTCGAVLCWPEQINERQLRRLQLAAEEGHSMGLLFHSQTPQVQSSPAALRMEVQTNEWGMEVNILKRRGAWPTGPIHIDWNHEAATMAMPLSATASAQRSYAN
jgi:cell division inhibitor SulA/protein ImuA